MPQALNPRERKPIPIVWEAGWASGPAGMCAENLAPIRIRSSCCPVRSEGLYRLRHDGNLAQFVYLNSPLILFVLNI
jgi:hypothetical protein